MLNLGKVSMRKNKTACFTKKVSLIFLKSSVTSPWVPFTERKKTNGEEEGNLKEEWEREGVYTWLITQGEGVGI